MYNQTEKIAIFIGSSIEDLELERAKLMSFIQGLNTQYHDRGLYFEGYACEETPSEMIAGGSQKKHNDYIKDSSDVAIFMFFHKAGEFTLNELALAREVFLSKGTPHTFVFFKAVDGLLDAAEDIKKCVDLVSNEYGHYYKIFDNIDTVKLEILLFIASYLPGMGEVSIDNGKVMLNGVKVSGLNAVSVFAYQNNPDLKKLDEERRELLSKMTAASAAGDENEALRISVGLGEVQKKDKELEGVILDAIKYFFEENRKGKSADPRRMEALRLLE